MSNSMIIMLVGLIGGIAIGLQAPLSSIINQRLGVMESVFIVHLGGMLAIGVPLLLVGGGKLGAWATVPWYALAAGMLGIVVVSAVVFMVPRVGVGASVVLIVCGQLTIAATIDHFGMLGVEPRALTAERMLGLGTVLLGVWLTMRR